jgi:hypothetical protein
MSQAEEAREKRDVVTTIKNQDEDLNLIQALSLDIR